VRRVLHRRVLYEGHVELVVLDVETDDGRHAQYPFGAPPPFVAALVVTAEGEAVLVRQERPPIGERVIELPAGGRREGESDEEAMRREIAEECLLEVGRLVDLGETLTSPGTSSERGRLFLALDCVPAPGAAEQEHVERIRLPLRELVERVASGVILDAMAAAVLGRALARGVLPAG